MSIYEKFKSTSLIDIFPNPVKDQARLSLELSRTSDVNVEIYDVTGRMIQSIYQRNLPEGKNILTLNTQNILNGIYLVKVMADKFLSRSKMIVNK
jgi:hypothetical protein